MPRHRAPRATEAGQGQCAHSAAHTDLDLLFALVADLYRLANDPERAENEHAVYDFSIRWGALLSGRLQRLHHYYHRGRLDPGERERYEQLAGELDRARPVLDRVQLPPAAIDLLS